MKFYQYVGYLLDSGFRELGYFSGIRAFMNDDTLITIQETHGGFSVSFDSVKRNIGEVYFVYNDGHLCQLLSEVLHEN